MMKVLVLGAGGMLGHKITQRLAPRFEVVGTVRGEATLPDVVGGARIVGGVRAEEFGTVESVLDRERPDVVFNAIGVVKQLPTSANVVSTLAVNSIFPHLLAERAGAARVITMSTDCVFDGARGSYRESDPSDACDLYGRSKSLGEIEGEGRLTIRTSIIGRDLGGGHGLVEWFLSNRGGGPVKGFPNAIFSGFPTIVLADIVGDIIEKHRDLSGVWHVAAEPIDKFRLLSLVNAAFGAGIAIERDEDGLRIDRSLDGERFCAATGFSPASWESMIDRMASDPTPYDTIRK